MKNIDKQIALEYVLYHDELDFNLSVEDLEILDNLINLWKSYKENPDYFVGQQMGRINYYFGLKNYDASKLCYLRKMNLL